MEALVEQEFRDAGYEELVRRSAEFSRLGRDQSIRAISEIAALHIRHRYHWKEFQVAHGIALKPRRGPTARSIFQPICRHLLGLDEGGDQMGLASVWAAVLDEWAETEVAPADIPVWITNRGGMRAIYEGQDDLIRQTDSDIVYTSPDLARRIVDYLNPQGFCVDPCRRRGAFYDAFDPENRDWCEIREGRDFLTWEFDRPVAWCVTNPPFSDAYADIAARAFSISENVAFLVKLTVALGTYARHQAWREAGHGLREIIYLPWADAGFLTEDHVEKAPEGFVLAVVWWQRGWKGDVQHTDWTSTTSDVGGARPLKAVPYYELIDENNTTFEWYTPRYIFDAMGCNFDLDPASPGSDVVPWVPARRHYTNTGLEQEWSGFVWLNPPYGRDILPDWIEKFIEHGNGIALVPDRGSTAWWQELAAHADLILFLNKKIPFISSDGEQTRAFAIGNTLVGIGEKAVTSLFAAARNGLGLLVKPIPVEQSIAISRAEAAE